MAPATKAGSGAAALALAERTLERGTRPRTSRSSSIDPNGFAAAIKYLEMARSAGPPAVAAVANGYLVEARVRQVEHLGGRRDWPAMVGAASGRSRLTALARSADAGDRQWAGWAAKVADSGQLARFRSEVEELADRQRVVPNQQPRCRRSPTPGRPRPPSCWPRHDRTQAHGEDRRIVSHDPGGWISTRSSRSWPGGHRRRPRTPAVAAAAAGYLFNAAVGGVRAAADRRAWAQAIGGPGRRRRMTAADGVPADQKRWRDLAERTLMAFRADAADLDKRREGFPDLTAQVQPLADAKVYAALLAQAERYMGYEAGNPRGASARPATRSCGSRWTCCRRWSTRG